MKQNYHLDSNEQNAMQVKRYVQDYATNALEMQLVEHPLPSDVSTAASDFMTDLIHYASIHGVASDVLSKAFQNYLEEISGGDVPNETICRFRAIVDDAIYEATIGAALSTPANPKSLL